MNSTELLNRFFLITDLYLPEGVSLTANPQVLTHLRETFQKKLIEKIDCCFYYRWWLTTTNGFNEPVLRAVIGFKKNAGSKFTGNITPRQGENIKFTDAIGELWDETLQLNGFICQGDEYLISADYHRVRETDASATKRLVGLPLQQKDQGDKLHCYHVILRREQDTPHVRALTNPIMRGITWYEDEGKFDRNGVDEGIAVITLTFTSSENEETVDKVISGWAKGHEDMVTYRKLKKGYYVFVLVRPRERIAAKTQTDRLYQAIKGVVDSAQVLYFRDFETTFMRKQSFNIRVERILNSIGLIEDTFNNRHLFEEGFESRLNNTAYFQYP